MRKALSVLAALGALAAVPRQASAQLGELQQTVEVAIGPVVYMSVNGNTSDFTTTAGDPTVTVNHFNDGFWAYADPTRIVVKANVATQVQIAALSGTARVAAAGGTGNPSKSLDEFRWGTSPLGSGSRGTSLSTTPANVGSVRAAGNYSAAGDQLQVYYGVVLDWDDKPDTYSVPVVFTVITG